nr:hypothetical protein [Leptospira kirschneri]
MFYGDFVFKFFSLDSILFALFDILTLFQGRLCRVTQIEYSKIPPNKNLFLTELSKAIESLMFCFEIVF